MAKQATRQSATDSLDINVLELKDLTPEQKAAFQAQIAKQLMAKQEARMMERAKRYVEKLENKASVDGQVIRRKLQLEDLNRRIKTLTATRKKLRGEIKDIRAKARAERGVKKGKVVQAATK